MKVDIAQLEFIDKTLRKIALAIEEEFKVEFTITSIYRMGDPGVHGQLPVRGLDLRCDSDDLGNDVAFFVNNRFLYNGHSGKLCCVYHDVGQGKHIHLQTHPNTAEI